MKPETARKGWEALLYFLLILACVLLIVIFFQLKSDSGRCIRNPRGYLVEHFEKITDGNISCTCITDNPRTLGSSSYKIVFGSYGVNEMQEEEWYKNIITNHSQFNFSL